MPSKEYYKRLNQLQSPKPTPKPKKKQERVRVTEAALYNRKKDQLQNCQELLSKWLSERVAIHKAIKNFTNIVPVFAALRTIDQKLVKEKGIHLEDISILLFADQVELFPKQKQHDQAGLNRLVKRKFLLMTQVKKHRNYMITFEGKSHLLTMKKYVLQSLSGVLKTLKKSHAKTS